MNTRKNYKTKQRELILSCLLDNQDRHVTVDMMMEYLKSKGQPVGQTTIYRNLDKLVQEGTVLKYTTPEGMSNCYQYGQPREDCRQHYHLMCIECGHLTHLSCSHLSRLSAHM